jgi:transposase
LDELGYKENNIHRDRLILMVNQKGGMSIRKTAEMLMLNRGIVYKVMLENRDND